MIRDKDNHFRFVTCLLGATMADDSIHDKEEEEDVCITWMNTVLLTFRL